MPATESTAKNFAVTAAVACVCSFAVSLASVGLRARQQGAQDLERMRHVLTVAGLYDPEIPVSRAFARVEERVIDLDTGEYVAPDAADPAATTVIPPDEDIAGVERRPRYRRVYLVRDVGRVQQIVLPVEGQGWSMLHGFLALDRDLMTVRGISFYSHEETAGLGADVDKPAWRAQWAGKRLFGPGGDVALRVVKGGAKSLHEVDAITGASMTSDGVQNLVRFWFGSLGYRRYLERLERLGVDHG